MKKRGGWTAPRRGRALLLALALPLLLPLGRAWEQPGGPAALQRRVRLAPGRRSLGAVLADLSRQTGLTFSYSSSLVPLGQPYYLPAGPPRPAGEVLRDVLAAAHLAYGVVGGQLVLWPERAAPPGMVLVDNQTTRPVPDSRPAAPLAVAAGPVAKVTGRRPAGAASAVVARRAAPLPAPPAGGRPGRLARGKIAPLSAALTPAYPPALGRGARRGLPGRAARSPTLPVARYPPATRRLASRALPPTSAPTATTKAGRAATSALRPTYPAPSRPVAAGRASLAMLAFRPAFPAPASAPAEAFLPGRELLKIRPAHGSRADSAAPPLVAAPRRPRYLHGEAWASETLPLTAAGKLGWARLYLVVGVAAGPFDTRGGWAWGGGLGTAGQPKGRFTLSLDLLHWVVAGDDDGPRGHLTQLRPAVAWQLRRGSRWQLVGGPTLNLATTPDLGPGPGRPGFGPGPGPRRALGPGQWNWLDADGGRADSRLWPGVQVGLRF